MEDLRRIQNPVTPPQPVGQGSRNQPGRRRKEEFRDLLERESGEESPPEEKVEETWQESDRERIEEKDGDPGRGLLIDERA